MSNEIVGGARVCEILGITRATMVRQIQAKKIVPLGRLESGAWLFDLKAIQKLAKAKEK